jgi:hypothetical protein
MAIQMWQVLRVATVKMTTSLATGSRVVVSNSAVIFRNPLSISGEDAIRATAAGR